jgi:TRAP-type C4-dicarboxylate transport system permease large subunit
MIVLSLNISLMTPPVGACLFVISSITGERLETIAKELWPFILLETAVLFLIAFWPTFTLFMPRLLLGK